MGSHQTMPHHARRRRMRAFRGQAAHAGACTWIMEVVPCSQQEPQYCGMCWFQEGTCRTGAGPGTRSQQPLTARKGAWQSMAAACGGRKQLSSSAGRRRSHQHRHAGVVGVIPAEVCREVVRLGQV